MRAFSMLELAVVMLTVVILLTAGVFGYTRFTSSAQDAAAKSSVESLYSAALALGTGRVFDTSWFTGSGSASADAIVRLPEVPAGPSVKVVADPQSAASYASDGFSQFSLAMGVMVYEDPLASAGTRFAGLAVKSKSGNCVVAAGSPEAAFFKQAVLSPDPDASGSYRTSSGTSVPCTGLASFLEYSSQLGSLSAVPLLPDGSLGEPSFQIGAPPPGQVPSLLSPPPVPSLSAGEPAPGATQLHLSIEPVPSTQHAPLTGYRIYRQEVQDGPFTLLADQAQLPFTDTQVLPGGTYSYAVSSYGPGGSSTLSTPLAVAVPPALQAPSAPAGLAIAAPAPGATALQLSWSIVDSAPSTPVTGYRLYRWDPRLEVFTLLTQTLTTSFTDTQVLPDAEYFYAVSTYGDGGEGVRSALVSTFIPPALQAPAAPSGLSVATPAAGDTHLLVSWSRVLPAPNTPVTGYRLYIKNPTTDAFELLTQTFDTSFTHTNLEVSHPYTFAVSTYGDGGEGVRSEEVTVSIPPALTPPPAPDLVTVSLVPGSTSSLAVSWTASVASDTAPVSGYRLERLAGDNWQPVLTLASTSYTPTGLTWSLPYTFRVFAYGPGGQSPAAVSTPVTIPEPLPDPAGPAGPGAPAVLDRAVFSAANFSVTNRFTLKQGIFPAAVYTGGNFSCDSNVTLDAYVHARGAVSLTNSCSVGGVWSTGDVNTSTAGVAVRGSITSARGSLYMANTPISIQGPVTVKGTVTARNGKDPKLTVSVRTGVDTIPAPPVYSLPIFRYDPSQWTGWNIVDWTDAARDAGRANGAPAWALTSSMCEVASTGYSLNGSLRTPGVPTVWDASKCSTLTFNSLNLVLNSDLVLVVDSFTSSNSLTVTSGDGKEHTLRIISPWQASSTASCASSGAGDISFDSGGVSISPLVPTLLFGAGRVSLVNGMTFSGQVYGCLVNVANNVEMTYRPVGMG